MHNKLFFSCIFKSTVCIFKAKNCLISKAGNSSLVKANSFALFKLTCALLLLVFCWILISCQSSPKAPLRRPAVTAPELPSKEGTRLYLKQEKAIIKPLEQGSTTGSIWADQKNPRQLIADHKPTQPGDYVTVVIPDELQFHESLPDASDANSTAQKKLSKEVSPKSQNPQEQQRKQQNVEQIADNLADPFSTSPLSASLNLPVSRLQMQVIANEPNGDLYLRGIKQYTSSNGQKKNVVIFAKVPERNVTEFEINAKQLTEVAVTETIGNQVSEYSATGWDRVVSRRIAGFNPDLKAEIEHLNNIKDELRNAQLAVKDQYASINKERERLLKERQRNNQEVERLREALSKTESENPGKPGSNKETERAASPTTTANAKSQPTNLAQNPAGSTGEMK